jgi:hypothetical protein
MKSLGWQSVHNLSLQMGRDLLLPAEAVFVGIENVSRTVDIGRGTKFTIEATSAGVPGSTVHTGTCELELAQWEMSKLNSGKPENPGWVIYIRDRRLQAHQGKTLGI